METMVCRCLGCGTPMDLMLFMCDVCSSEDALTKKCDFASTLRAVIQDYETDPSIIGELVSAP